MGDIVVTVPKTFTWSGSPNRGLRAWVDEGDCAGQPWSGQLWCFTTRDMRPDIAPGERVYVVCEGKLRGYAPLVKLGFTVIKLNWGKVELWRGGDAVAVTLPSPVRGFPGWKYRWWKASEEVPFPDWLEGYVPGEQATLFG